MRNLAKLSILAVFLLTLPISAQVKQPALSKAPKPTPMLNKDLGDGGGGGAAAILGGQAPRPVISCSIVCSPGTYCCIVGLRPTCYPWNRPCP